MSPGPRLEILVIRALQAHSSGDISAHLSTSTVDQQLIMRDARDFLFMKAKIAGY